jgi:hypothetical protein
MTDREEDGWQEYRALVLSELKRLSDHVTSCEAEMRKEVKHSESKLLQAIDRLHTSHAAVKADVIRLKTQAAIWGLMAGTAVSVLTAFVSRLLK